MFKMKMSQIDTENDKNPKVSKFQRYYAFFVDVSTDFVDSNVFEGQQRKNWFTCSLL